MNYLFTEVSRYVSTDDFYSKVEEKLKKMNDEKNNFAIGTMDIDHFNYINDLFGFETGDQILRNIAEHLSKVLDENDFFTRLHADVFAVYVNVEKQENVIALFSKIINLGMLIRDTLPSGYKLTTSSGGIFVKDMPPSVSSLLDKANYARQKAKGSMENEFHLYDEKMNEELQWQKNVTFSMKTALDNHEFVMYLQPKFSIKGEHITGAEALVRWNHPQLGLIGPDKFIPVMEQSGFVQKLDFYMLKEACLFLKECGETGIPQVPISVNFSKVHLTNKKLVEQIFHTVNQVGISIGMIEIEFTESIFVNGFEHLAEIVTDLKLLGFRVSLDDFGSAYSSLNCLKELPFDIIKIDKGFLQDSANTEKGKLIIAKIVEMIKSLGMLSIMEGVETMEQVEFLRRLSCDYAQGYFYAKPMRQDTYVDFLSKTRAIRKDGKVIVLQGRSSCVIDDQGRPIGLYAFQDVTEELARVNTLQKSLTDKIKELEASVQSEREAREALFLSEERYRIIVEQSDDIMFDWDFVTDTVIFTEKYTQLFGTPSECINPRENPNIRQRIHPDDLSIFEKWLEDCQKREGIYRVEFRKMDVNENYIWLCCSSTVICDSRGCPIRAIGLLSNINAQKNQLAALTYKSQRDSLTKALNREEMRLQVQTLLEKSSQFKGAFFMIDIDNFKTLNDQLGHQLGDTVLIKLTNKLVEILPKESLVGRMGGDEFGAYLKNVGEDEVYIYADLLIGALRMSYYGATKKYDVSASIGISLYPGCGNNFEELYYRADIALYESKRSGKDCYTVYKDSIARAKFDTCTSVEWTEGFLHSYFQEDFSFRVFEMLYETKDVNASISRILELLGIRFQIDRVYIFQNDDQKLFSSNTYEWCAPGITSEKENLQQVPIELHEAYFPFYSSEGVYSCPDFRKAPKELYDLCVSQGIKSMIHCAICNAGSQVGFIGFDMCRSFRDWSGEEIAMLGYISRILSVFLIKLDITLELQDTYQNYVEMVENLSGFVYVVDLQTHEVVYANDATKELGISAQYPCYEMIFGIDEPCSNCPLKHLDETTNSATEEIYSVLLQKWVCVSASKIKWEGKDNAGLVCCTDISKYKKDPPSISSKYN